MKYLTKGVKEIKNAEENFTQRRKDAKVMNRGRERGVLLRLSVFARNIFGRFVGAIHESPLRLANYCCASLPIIANIGMYIEMTMPPTTTPRNRMIIGSISEIRLATAESTSSS